MEPQKAFISALKCGASGFSRSIWDFGMVKFALILLGMIIGAYISGFVRQYMLYFAVVVVVLYAILIYKVFKR